MNKPEINFIVAVANDNAIGKDNKLLWHLPADLKFFKETTMGCPIIMGRKTYESIGRPLPGRRNIVITRNTSYNVTGVEVVSSVEKAMEVIKNEAKIFVIGGSEIFSQMLEQANYIFVTRVEITVNDADVFFQELNPQDWKLIWEEKHLVDEKNKFNYTFQKYARV